MRKKDQASSSASAISTGLQKKTWLFSQLKDLWDIPEPFHWRFAQDTTLWSAPLGLGPRWKTQNVTSLWRLGRGMDDVSNLSKILERLIREGCSIKPTGCLVQWRLSFTILLGTGDFVLRMMFTSERPCIWERSERPGTGLSHVNSHVNDSSSQDGGKTGRMEKMEKAKAAKGKTSVKASTRCLEIGNRVKDNERMCLFLPGKKWKRVWRGLCVGVLIQRRSLCAACWQWLLCRESLAKAKTMVLTFQERKWSDQNVSFLSHQLWGGKGTQKGFQQGIPKGTTKGNQMNGLKPRFLCILADRVSAILSQVEVTSLKNLWHGALMCQVRDRER